MGLLRSSQDWDLFIYVDDATRFKLMVKRFQLSETFSVANKYSDSSIYNALSKEPTQTTGQNCWAVQPNPAEVRYREKQMQAVPPYSSCADEPHEQL